MSTFVKLTPKTFSPTVAAPGPTWINLDHVIQMDRYADYTSLTMDQITRSGGYERWNEETSYVAVIETPEQILAHAGSPVAQKREAVVI